MGGGDGLVLDQALHYSTAGTVGISYRRLRRECGDLRIQFGQLPGASLLEGTATPLARPWLAHVAA